MLQRDLKFDGGEGQKKLRRERKKERQKESRTEGEGEIR